MRAWSSPAVPRDIEYDNTRRCRRRPGGITTALGGIRPGQGGAPVLDLLPGYAIN